MNDTTPFRPDELPPVVVRYLDAQHDRSQRQATSELFAADARVVDEGIEYQGIAAIRGWLGSTVSEFTFTTTFTGQQRVSPTRWDVLARLEGDFPGGVADLRFRISWADDLITDLVIAP